MNWPDILASTLRGASLAAVLSALGTLVFRLAVRPDALATGDIFRRLDRLARAGLGAATVLTVIWLVTQSAAIAGASGWREVGGAIPTVVLRTQFGHFVLARLLLLAAAVLLTLPALPAGDRRRIGSATAVVAGALVLQPMMGHAGAIGGAEGAELIASEGLHLVAAGAWLGGLLPLLIVLRRTSLAGARAAAQDFGSVGLGCAVMLGCTGLLQGLEMIGGLAGLVGTAYGRVALLKLALFALLLALAATNRFVFTRRLASAMGQTVRNRLIASVGLETLLGVLVVLAAGELASLAPSVHEQPIWPFPLRPSLDALFDPARAWQVAAGALGMTGAIIAIGAAVIRRRRRWGAMLAAGVLASVSMPLLGPLLVDAYPSSFFTSPTEFGDSGIVRGARLFAANCAACHGIDGRGGGPAAAGLAVAPADLTADHLWAHTDGDLFWWLSNGYVDPTAGPVMPGFAAKLSSDARWDLIDYLHAHNAGVTMQTTGTWTRAPPVPQFDALCDHGRDIDLDDLRGQAVLFVAGDPPATLPSLPGLTVIRLLRTTSAEPTGPTCVSAESDTWDAFAILLGLPPDRLSGAQILADRAGWLRRHSLPGLAGGWIGNHAALARALADIEAHPMQVTMAHHHH